MNDILLIAIISNINHEYHYNNTTIINLTKKNIFYKRKIKLEKKKYEII